MSFGGASAEEREISENNPETYCGMDTIAMLDGVKVLNRLLQVAGVSKRAALRGQPFLVLHN